MWQCAMDRAAVGRSSPTPILQTESEILRSALDREPLEQAIFHSTMPLRAAVSWGRLELVAGGPLDVITPAESVCFVEGVVDQSSIPVQRVVSTRDKVVAGRLSS